MAGTRKISDYIAFARRRVFDNETPYRYGDAYFIDGLNQAISVLYEMRPELFSVPVVEQLVAGSLQDISGAHPQSKILNVTRNMGTDGTTVGDVVYPTMIGLMDAADPQWYQATASTTVVHWMPAPDSTHEFYVWPPQPPNGTGDTRTQGYVEQWIAEHPAYYDPVTYDPDNETPADVVNPVVTEVDDRFFASVGNFMAAFVLQTDDEDPSTNAKVDRFMNAFLAQVTPGRVAESEGAE